MSSPSTLLSLFFYFFFLFISSSLAFNITTILKEHSDFSSFNDLLTKTKLADQINNRQTITVLAVDNSAASSLSSLSPDEAKRALSLHVILDYYDKEKLEKLQNKTALLTTLLQASGQAGGQQQGFVNATVMSSGTVAFGSAAPGSSLNSNLINSVASEPYNVSVLHVSSVISMSGSGSPSSAPVGPPNKSPESPNDSPGSPTNSPGSPSEAPVPSARPPRSAKSPSGSEANDTSSMGSSPPLPGSADGPATDSTPAADAPKGESASVAVRPSAIFGSSVKVGVVVGGMMIVMV